MIAQLSHRRKAIVAAVVAVASVVVAISADSTAGHVAAALLAVLGTGGAVHQTRNAPKPHRPVKPQKRV